jgi:hypothetical protein
MMDTDSLLKMKNSLEIFKSAIVEANNTKKYINNDNIDESIKNIVCKYNDFFSDIFIKYLNADIEKIISEINNKIKLECEHEVITDYIDVFPDRCLPIKYCVKCNLTLDN